MLQSLLSLFPTASQKHPGVGVVHLAYQKRRKTSTGKVSLSLVSNVCSDESHQQWVEAEPFEGLRKK